MPEYICSRATSAAREAHEPLGEPLYRRSAHQLKALERLRPATDECTQRSAARGRRRALLWSTSPKRAAVDGRHRQLLHGAVPPAPPIEAVRRHAVKRRQDARELHADGSGRLARPESVAAERPAAAPPCAHTGGSERRGGRRIHPVLGFVDGWARRPREDVAHVEREPAAPSPPPAAPSSQATCRRHGETHGEEARTSHAAESAPTQARRASERALLDGLAAAESERRTFALGGRAPHRTRGATRPRHLPHHHRQREQSQRTGCRRRALKGSGGAGPHAGTR